MNAKVMWLLTMTGRMCVICPVSSKTMTEVDMVCVTDPAMAAAPGRKGRGKGGKVSRREGGRKGGKERGREREGMREEEDESKLTVQPTQHVHVSVGCRREEGSRCFRTVDLCGSLKQPHSRFHGGGWGTTPPTPLPLIEIGHPASCLSYTV